MNFRIQGLPAERFRDLFALPSAELAKHNAVRMVADGRPAFPCRISLTDAQANDEVILVNYEHHAVATPFRSSFAIYVRPGQQTYDEVNRVPDQLRRRTLSLRAYSEAGMMLGAEVVAGTELESALERLFSLESTAYIHAHFAAAGCYAARIERA